MLHYELISYLNVVFLVNLLIVHTVCELPKLISLFQVHKNVP